MKRTTAWNNYWQNLYAADVRRAPRYSDSLSRLFGRRSR